jgi:RHS repeat-associated protein
VSDPAGNVVALVDAGNGTTAATYEYGPFGEPLAAAGAAAALNPFRFSSRYLDAETADSALPLYYFGHRFYTPALGRWLNRDPLGEEGGPNLYAFVANAPLQAVDPLGLALYAFDGTWNDREKMKRPTNVAKLAGVYRGIAHYEKGVGTDWQGPGTHLENRVYKGWGRR